MLERAPGNVRSLIEQVGFVEELAEEDAEAMYAPAREGKCMTCHTDVGETALVFVNKHGIIGLYCGGACAQDIAVAGWIQEQFDDIRQRIEFRGGGADSAENDEES